jgi:hypothetical protein
MAVQRRPAEEWDLGAAMNRMALLLGGRVSQYDSTTTHRSLRASADLMHSMLAQLYIDANELKMDETCRIILLSMLIFGVRKLRGYT